MEPISPKLKKRKTGTYDDGTLSYAATSPSATSEVGFAPTQNTGTDTTTPYAHAPATQMYFTPENIDTQQGYREEGQKQYGIGSDYYKGLDQKGKLDFINKIGTSNAPVKQNLATGVGLMDKFSDKVAAAAAAGGGKTAGQQKMLGNIQKTSDSFKQQIIDKAYQKAAHNAYDLNKIGDPEILKQLGPAAPHTEWREVFDNVTGKSLGYYQDDMKSGQGGWWAKANARNPDAMQAGIGAIAGLVTGGIPGAIVGGAAGWAAGDKVKQANKQQHKLENMQNRLAFKQNAARSLGLRDVARSRAAGAGTFNYTEQAGA